MPAEVLGRGVTRLVEGIVDDQPPGPRPGPEVVLGQPAGVADVAEDEVHGAAGAAPDDRVGVDAEDVGVGRAVTPERVPDQVLDQLAAAAVVVLALGVLDDRLVVDVGQLYPDHRVARIAADVNLRDPPGPFPDLARTMLASLPGSGDLIEPWLREASRDAVSSFSAGTLGATAASSSVLASRSSAQNAAGIRPGSAKSSSLRLWALSRIGRSLSRYRAVADRNSAAACGSRACLPLDDVVEGVADRDDVIDGQRVPPVDQHLLHDLQRGPFPLHDAASSRSVETSAGRERVGQPERLLVGAAVPVVGVDPVEQHVPDVGAAVEPGERGGDDLARPAGLSGRRRSSRRLAT